MSNSLKIIVPFYNPGEFLETCVATIMSQKHDNYKVIFIDDASTDNSWDLLPHDDDRAICIRNEKNVTALPNLHMAIMDHCDPDDIVCIVDGDDWLPHKKVLKFIDDYYTEHNCWVTYGQARWTDGRRGFATHYTERDFNRIRKSVSDFKISHLRTFRAGAYQILKEQDSDFSCLKDNNGEFYKMTYDVAIMLPLLEVSGFSRVKFINEILYTYNRDNPISDDKKNQALQTGIHIEILSKPPFKRVEKYK